MMEENKLSKELLKAKQKTIAEYNANDDDYSKKKNVNLAVYFVNLTYLILLWIQILSIMSFKYKVIYRACSPPFFLNSSFPLKF